ncbi:DPP IV N-terminal domain-containing protein [uncultured Sphingomonas sp.]|uniref:S9 family peptidase n=1 Tax=uncultured Sphingomonas sp. TaxID=158754 RepID=UPI0025CC66DF|nr:DPP IV N-terminal domain-containing protein [uncultured Sphingomonas sp.]
MTDADYSRAVHQLAPWTVPLVDHAVRAAHWVDARRFWYVDTDHGVPTIMLVDAAKGSKAPAFDTKALLASLNAAGFRVQDATKLYVADFAPDFASNSAVLNVGGKRYTCAMVQPYGCKESATPSAGHIAGYLAQQGPADAVLSPDGTRAAFVRNWNLWVRDMRTGAERQLTTDGVKDFGYATDNAGWKHSDQAIVIWSPDSKKLATFQQDQRAVADFSTTTTQVGHSKVDTWKYPFVGDKEIIQIQRVIVDVDAGQVIRLKMPAEPHRSSLCDDVVCGEGPQDMQWAKDAKTLAFVSTSRDHKVETVRIADAASGAVRDVFTETVPTWFDSGYNDEGINWRYLSERGEILWWSQRDDWGHYYLYNAATGKLVRQVTQGPWNVDHPVYIDERSGKMLVAGVGREPGTDPYYRSIYAVDLKGGAPKLLTPEKQDHIAIPSSDGRYFVDIYSTPQAPQTAVLRRADGSVVQQLAKGDATRLQAAGWQAPESIAVQCSDGKTLCHGLLFKPAGLDPQRKYPVIDYVYPGPFMGTIPSRQFAAAQGDAGALAQLGFAVVEIDALGTPRRSKTFQDYYYRDMGKQAVPDQKSGIEDLGKRYAWLDLDRVGIWGHSGGGNATATAMFLYPDFFKVGIAESGNHDNRNYEDDFYEKYLGLLERQGDKSNYDLQANQDLAKNLKGKLLLAHGMLDDNVPVSSTLLVVDALEKANKDFDLVLFPRAHHGYGDQSFYMMRRRWDYFVENLMGATPPKEYRIERAAN